MQLFCGLELHARRRRRLKFFLGARRDGWAFGSNGSRWHDNLNYSNALPTYSWGSVVTFTLDLTGSGELSASFDGGQVNHLLFQDMLLPANNGGLIPSFLSAALLNCRSVRFKGFDTSSYH